MERAMKRKVTITGTGSASGGVYDSIRITGEAQLGGNIETETFLCTGNCQAGGDFRATSARIVGEMSVAGDYGGSRLKLLGNLNVGGSAKSSLMKSRGQLDVSGECEADDFQARGGFQIHGLLSADRVDIGMYGPCYAKEIGGSRIRIRRSRLMGLKMMFTRQGALEFSTETIEGDTVYVEHTKADVIRGNIVEVGPECEIGYIEYRQSLKKSKDSIVRDAKQL